MTSCSDAPYGITLANGSQIVHGNAARIKNPFDNITVTLNELSPGSRDGPAFRGPSGFIEFDTTVRLPRHVHIASCAEQDGVQYLIHERIFVVGGVALVELGGEIHCIPPMTLVTIAPGVPHTWTACPADVNISKITGTETAEGEELISSGKFLMIYEYEEATGFFPTAQTKKLAKVTDYVFCDDLESIRIPALKPEDVKKQCWFVKDGKIQKFI